MYVFIHDSPVTVFVAPISVIAGFLVLTRDFLDLLDVDNQLEIKQPLARGKDLGFSFLHGFKQNHRCFHKLSM